MSAVERFRAFCNERGEFEEVRQHLETFLVDQPLHNFVSHTATWSLARARAELTRYYREVRSPRPLTGPSDNALSVLLIPHVDASISPSERDFLAEVVR